MDWTAEAIDRLRGLWAEGHSTAEIGRRMGISKNAVVGKAHRLNLPARPSPIRREPAEGQARMPRSAAARPAARPAVPRPSPVPVMVAAAPTVVRRFPPLSAARACCWPIGEPGTKEFRFCSAEATSGKPYCAQHASVAYVKTRDRREDAA
ncbi:MAG TPA: GcrA family cell cycle regulator [Acetobacteraceae bacterium]|nr:GcrA family cell cycle regulator [Acetobacteraceae bacterium]